jgi:hypothetical protein
MRQERLDSSIRRKGALVAIVCLSLGGACSGEDAGDEGAAAGAAGAGGSSVSSSGGRGGAAATNGGSGGRAGSGGMGGSPAVAAGGGRPAVGGSAGAGGSSGAAGAAGSGGGGGAAGAGGSDGEGGAAGAGGSGGEAGVGYAADVQPILEDSCSPCHSGLGFGQHNAASVYSDAVRVADAILDEIESGGMPPACGGGDPGDAGCVSEEDLEVLEQWVDDDAPP